ncbi:XRE family transcriptional regulator [Streptomyces sp. NPDC097640]|uniref:XRE family transcriptional regulator n=1 Tax=Streptomyces sp. NPDC097640 TaxID=3157229 RepID=UPI003316C502
MTHLLVRARAVRGWKAPELARRLRELGAKRGTPVGTRKDGVYRWEASRRPDEPTQRLIAELLNIPQIAVDPRRWPHWLALDPLQQPTRYSWDASGAIQALAEVSGRDITMDRRDFSLLTGATLTASLWAWLTADPAAAGQIAQARRLGETAVARIEERVRQLRHADDIDGGGQLLTETAASLELVVRLLKDRSYTNAHGARLLAAAADLARMHAWAIFDVHDTCADGIFNAALRSAHASADTVLGSHILAFWSIAAHNADRPADAEAMTNAALSAARGRTTPRVEAMLYSRRARARAHQSNPVAFADLDQAAALLDIAGHAPGEDPEWVAWFDRSELLGTIASTHLDMNQPNRAEETFIEAAALFPAERVRTHTLFLVRRADAQWRQNDLERACATAHQALDITEEISSHRAAGPLRALAVSMGERTEIPAVRDFRERVATTLAT